MCEICKEKAFSYADCDPFNLFAVETFDDFLKASIRRFLVIYKYFLIYKI